MHSRHVGTHIQKKPKGYQYPPINPQTRKRTLLATAPSYEAIQSVTGRFEVSDDETQIRRIKGGFGLYRRTPIKKK